MLKEHALRRIFLLLMALFISAGILHAADPDEAWKQGIRKSLMRRVTFTFVDTPLVEAVSFLNAETKVGIVFDPKVLKEGTDKTPITLGVKNTEAGDALKKILDIAGLDYKLRDRKVFITPRANGGAAQKTNDTKKP